MSSEGDDMRSRGEEMRHVLLIGLVTGVLAMTTTGVASAQDDAEPRVILSPPRYELERVEIPEAGVAMLLPMDWDVDIRMQEGEFQLPPEYTDAGPIESLEIVYAEGGTGDWCSLTSYEGNPLSPEEHAKWDRVRLETGSQEDMDASDSIWVIGDELGHMTKLTASSGIGAVQEFVWDLGTTRYELLCASMFAANPSWQTIADSIEPTDADASAGPVSIELVGELQRVEVPEAGIAVSFPADWDVEVKMEPQEVALPPGYEDAPPATEWSVVYAPMPEAAGWCSLVMFTDMPMPFEEWADGLIPSSDAKAEGRPVSVDTVQLPIGEAIRIHDEYVENEYIFSTLYLFETGGSYYWLGCAQGTPAEDYWLSIAETLETLDPLADETDGAADEQVVEVPEAGIAVTFPAEWTVEIEMTEDEFASSDPDRPPVTYLSVLYAERSDGPWCQLYRYEWAGGDLLAFADTVVENYRADHGDDATADVSSIELAVGDAARVELVDPAQGQALLYYVFESEAAIFDLMCMGAETDPPAMDEIAQTLAWTTSVDGPTPEPGVEVESAAAVSGFGGEVEVADGLIMSADCELAAWVAFGDGSFREWLDCTLSDAPVAQPEWQGVRPHELLTVRGGECEWTSDYWAVTDGSEVWANSYELTITPDGRVFGSSFYAPELLECSD